MKSRVTPTDREQVMRDEDFIVSKTDLKGRITYGNRIFVEFSGYSEAELIGAQHNIIRHPDMPRGVFQLLWDSVRDEREIFAYVKNLAKDGSFYWVLANVTASVDARGQVIGYYSVRRKPRRDAVDAAADLYRLLQEEERQAGPRDAVAASTRLLNDLLTREGKSYETFVLGL